MSDAAGGGRTYRVAQWATGNIGLRSLRSVVEHPNLELVGLYTYSEAKAGKDAGELCGTGPTGVTATRAIDDIVAARPDCVLYMGDRADVEVLCRLLGSGINVVSTRSEFHRPAGMDAAVRERVEAACRRGGATLHSTGSSPGFITEALPLVLSSVQRRLDRLSIDEYADMSSRDSPEMIFRLMAFGRDPDSFDSRRWGHGVKAFGPSLSVVADALGTPIDDIEGTGEVAVARNAVEVAAGTVEAGTVAAQRMIVRCLHKGSPLLTFRSNWYLTTDLEPEWDLRPTGWRVLVEGDAPLDLNITFPVAAEDYAATTPGYTAHRPVNAVPYVCEAPPGIATITDLPQIVPDLSGR